MTSSDELLGARVAQLLDDAGRARHARDWKAVRALSHAVLALDPGNQEASALLEAVTHRRQMTLMFCDIVGSTAMAEACDPEEVSEILHRYRQTCGEVIDRFGGVTEDHRGDGMLVRFGDPEVHEDDARRAVLSSLELVRRVRELAGRLKAEYAIDLHVRVGVHTDIVLAEAGSVSGSAPNVASRVQTAAEPDSVVISDATHALVAKHFEVEPAGVVQLRGVARPIALFKVKGESDSGRPDGSMVISPFVGRQREYEQVEAMWRTTHERLTADRGELAPTLRGLLFIGPPGIGKSRLVHESVRRLGAPYVECRCSSYHETTSLFPFTRVLEHACAISPSDGVSERLAKLRARLRDCPDLPFLTSALRIPTTAISPPVDVDPKKLRDMAVSAAARLVYEQTGPYPSVLFIDDLHWADQSSLDLISVLLDDSCSGVCLLLSAREGFQSPWPESAVAPVELRPLADADVAQLVALTPAASRLSEADRTEVISRSDGIPLFVEELIRTAEAIEHGQVLHRSIAQADYAIPPALRDPLMARLDSPGVDLELAQVASTIGRDVSVDLLEQVSGVHGELLDRRLETLTTAGLVDHAGERAVRFRHELIREVAYETQTRAVRRRRHSLIADRMLRRGHGSPYADAGDIAFHLERAQRHEEAIEAHVSAGQSAQEVGAHAEATARLTRALDLIGSLADGPGRLQTELLVRELRGFNAVLVGGYAAPEAAEDHPRCVELCEQLGLGPELTPSLMRSWSYYAFRGNLREAENVNATIEKSLTQGEHDFPLAFAGRGLVGFFRGRFGESRRLMEAFVADPWGHTAERPPAIWPLPNDPLAAVTAHLVPILRIAGQDDAAWEMAECARRRAETLVFPYGPFSEGYVHSLLAMTRQMDCNYEAAARHGRKLAELGERHGFALWELAGRIQCGLSALHANDHAQHDQLVASVDAWRHALVADIWTPYWLTELGAAQRAVGREQQALQSLNDAVAAAGSGNTFYTAESLRMRGELRRELGDTHGVDDLRAAVRMAREQDAALFELRAAVSLARSEDEYLVAREALVSAIAHFSDDAHNRELDEARSLATL